MIKRSQRNKSYSSLLFENEVKFHAKLQHKNIVKFIGSCCERGEALLVYESMPNGSLADAITGTRVLLNWFERFKIIKGIARGVAYLHDCCGMHITHGDLNPERILLDSDMTPKITDFAFAKFCGLDGHEEHKGTFRGMRGHMDPGYIHGICSVKRDFYSFGVTLLEIITAKRPKALFTDEGHLLKFSTVGGPMEMYQMIDPVLHGEPRVAEIMRCIRIAERCTVPNGEDRPSMWDVLLMLNCESVPVHESLESWCDTLEADEGVLSDSDIGEPR